jgi:hypothetical protein
MVVPIKKYTEGSILISEIKIEVFSSSFAYILTGKYGIEFLITES